MYLRHLAETFILCEWCVNCKQREDNLAANFGWSFTQNFPDAAASNLTSYFIWTGKN